MPNTRVSLLELDGDVQEAILRQLRASDVLVTMCACASMRAGIASVVRDGGYCLPNDDDPLELLAAFRLLRKFPTLRHSSNHHLAESSVRVEPMASDTMIRLKGGSSIRVGALRERERVSLCGRLTHITDFFLIIEILCHNVRLREVDLSNNTAVLHMKHLIFASALLGMGVKMLVVDTNARWDTNAMWDTNRASRSSVLTVRNLDDLLLIHSASELDWRCYSSCYSSPTGSLLKTRCDRPNCYRKNCSICSAIPGLPHDVARWRGLRNKWSTEFVAKIHGHRLQWRRLHDDKLQA